MCCLAAAKVEIKSKKALQINLLEKKNRLSYAMCKRYFSSEVVVNAGVNLNNLL